MYSLNRESLNAGQQIPHYYGEDRLVLMPRDPHWLYAYWELTEPTRERTRAEALPLGVMALRVYRYFGEKEEVESHYDITLPEETDNWYLRVGVPDRKYHVELGWKNDRQFFSILRSNKVRTPRDAVSNVIDENWRLPDWQARHLFRRIALYHLSSPELHRQRRSIRHPRRRKEEHHA